MLSTVEYVKSAGGRRLATVHCGADLFLRTCYQVMGLGRRGGASIVCRALSCEWGGLASCVAHYPHPYPD